MTLEQLKILKEYVDVNWKEIEKEKKLWVHVGEITPSELKEIKKLFPEKRVSYSDQYLLITK